MIWHQILMTCQFIVWYGADVLLSFRIGSSSFCLSSSSLIIHSPISPPHTIELYVCIINLKNIKFMHNKGFILILILNQKILYHQIINSFQKEERIS
ncbi:hypothetical protein VIGAN_06148200 [Vigna angularis var. angularis]|uniref:Uncharacterized protein n=1 Tax=Vigna angularis var. angularis TaxID=157739 RepID=A0A0S3SBT9_PHAAN|nr:hypothetical protein VIGAN_06148200 [Vigna angularis var. angularis]